MEMAPEGTYKTRCTAIGIETTSTGKEYVSADFEISDEYGEETFIVEWRGWLTDKAMKRTIESLRLMGWHGDDLFELARDGAKDNEVNVDVRHEEYNGKTTARIAFINSADLDPAEIEKRRRALAEKFKAASADTKPTTAAKKEKKPKKESAPAPSSDDFPVADDDIPF